ncbi:MAG: hypothetical protein JO036_07970 [Candidatus Eremiobacteraeota bacterium]|nr:hypothetical protein [Candidatus Eremiobacteraeota bacterium]
MADAIGWLWCCLACWVIGDIATWIVLFIAAFVAHMDDEDRAGVLP